MTTLFSISPLRNVHDINVESDNGIKFVIDIFEQTSTDFDSTVIVLDNVTPNKGSWVYQVAPKSQSANDNFEAAMELIVKYINTFDTNVEVKDVHNPCNCPFVSELDQNTILSKLRISLRVRVN